MNAEPVISRGRVLRVLPLGACVALFLCTNANAVATSLVVPAHLVDTLTRTWEDPLSTKPPRLDEEALLAGDTAVSTCAALPHSDQPLSLAAAVDLALCNNPQVQIAWAGIKVQAGALGEARAAWLPTLGLSGSRLKDHTSFPGSDTASTTESSARLNGSLNWRLFDFGTRQANHSSAMALLDAALANHDAALQKTLTNVIQAYFEVQSAQAVWQARDKTQVLSQQLLESARRRQSQGAGAQSDTLQVASALAKATLETNRARGANAKALAVLVYTLGAPVGTPLTLAPELSAPEHELRQDLSAWLAHAKERHPALRAARAQLLSLQEKVLATRAEGLPSVDFSANFYQNGRPNQGSTPGKSNEVLVGLTLTIPVFDGFARSYKVRGSQAQVEQQQAQLQEAENQLLLDIVKAHAEASAALDNLAAAQSWLDSAQQAVSSVQRKFDKGAADTTEILSMQSALADAQQQNLSSRAEWRSARLRLLANAGSLGRTEIHQLNQHLNQH